MCSEEVVIESFETLKSNYRVVVLRSGAPYETKMKIYRFFRDLVDEINSYGRRALGRDLLDTEWLREPRVYRLSVRIKGRNIPKEAVIEIIGNNQYSEKERINPKENVFNLAEGEYLVRLTIEGSVAAQKQVFLDKDSELELLYQEPQKLVQRQVTKKVSREITTYARDPSLRIIYIAITLIAVAAALQILR